MRVLVLVLLDGKVRVSMGPGRGIVAGVEFVVELQAGLLVVWRSQMCGVRRGVVAIEGQAVLEVGGMIL